ncbi:hypothetical protein GBF38_020332, partial [Nibea albiflora]
CAERKSALLGAACVPQRLSPTAERYKETETERDRYSHEAFPGIGSTALLLSGDWISTGPVPATMGQCYTLSVAELWLYEWLLAVVVQSVILLTLI